MLLKDIVNKIAQVNTKPADPTVGDTIPTEATPPEYGKIEKPKINMSTIKKAFSLTQFTAGSGITAPYMQSQQQDLAEAKNIQNEAAAKHMVKNDNVKVTANQNAAPQGMIGVAEDGKMKMSSLDLSYIEGFVTKCGERSVDPEQVLEYISKQSCPVDKALLAKTPQNKVRGLVNWSKQKGIASKKQPLKE